MLLLRGRIVCDWRAVPPHQALAPSLHALRDQSGRGLRYMPTHLGAPSDPRANVLARGLVSGAAMCVDQAAAAAGGGGVV